MRTERDRYSSVGVAGLHAHREGEPSFSELPSVPRDPEAQFDAHSSARFKMGMARSLSVIQRAIAQQWNASVQSRQGVPS
jgi:hypothetical protein